MSMLRSTYAACLTITFMILSACAGGEQSPGTTTPDPTPSVVADAGQDQSVFLGRFVTLNGSKSTNANQTGLTYAWTLAKPAGSNATLSNPTSVNPTMTVDVEGTYEATLIVTDARQTSLSSAPDTVLVTAAKSNLPPTADAGDNQNVFVGRPVALDGSGSRASNNRQLTFNWSLTNRPSESTATLSNATEAKPSFTPDKSGSYVLQLVVNDGTNSSTPAEVTITAAVKPRPTANAGLPQAAKPETVITLDGSKSSSATGDPLKFSWSLSRPDGSPGILSKADTASPTFTADVAGLYVAQLIVNDGTDDSTPVTVQITVSTDVPVANAGSNKSVRVCHPDRLDGSASTNRTGGPISPNSYSWTLVSNPTGIAELANETTVSPDFTAYIAESYQINLVVSEGGVRSSPATVTVTATTNYSPAPNLQLPAAYGSCNSCHKVGNIDTIGNDDDLSRKGRLVKGKFRTIQGQPITHKTLSLTDPEIRDLCDFFQAN